MTVRWSERRHSRRHQFVEDHGILSAQMRPGHQVKLVDISAGGALIEATHRLHPGRLVELHIERTGQRITLRGRLLRCVITRLDSSSVWYRGAIVFDNTLAWLDDDPPIEARPPGARTTAASRPT